MNKRLIRKDTGAESQFMTGLNDTVYRGNQLIRLFNDSQSFKKIESMISFSALVADPVSYYNSILTDNIEHDTRLNVNPQRLAELYGIPRYEYLLALGMTKEQASKCQSCEPKDITIKLKVLSENQLNEFSKFLFFKSGKLEVNNNAVEQHRDSFNIYADSPETLQIIEHYEKLCDSLNSAIEYHKLGTNSMDTLARMFGLQILDFKLIPNYYTLSEQVKNMKYESIHSK